VLINCFSRFIQNKLNYIWVILIPRVKVMYKTSHWAIKVQFNVIYLSLCWILRLKVGRPTKSVQAMMSRAGNIWTCLNGKFLRCLFTNPIIHNAVTTPLHSNGHSFWLIAVLSERRVKVCIWSEIHIMLCKT
jgi:hypothetical protein